MIFKNIYEININEKILRKNCFFKKKIQGNKIHLIEIDPKTKNFITGGKYIILTLGQYRSQIFRKAFQEAKSL